MERWIWAGLLGTAAIVAPGQALQVGMPAPGFQALDQHGNSVQLADYHGKSTVVLYFYPKDGTPGCTAEACSLRDGYQAIQATGAVVLGVSADSVASHQQFAQGHDLPFPLLADPEAQVIRRYGVASELGRAKRITFIIDKQGTIQDIIANVDPATHDKQVLERLTRAGA